MKKLLVIASVSAVIFNSLEASANEDAEEFARFSAWRVSGGARFAMGLKTKMRFGFPASAYYAPTSPALGSGAQIGQMLSSGERVAFLDGAFIDPNSDYPMPYSQNWQVPSNALDKQTGSLTLNSAQSTGDAAGRASDEDNIFGASVEISRTLYVNEKGFGVDFAAGLAWMRRNNCFRGSASGTYLGRSTYVYTPSQSSPNFNNLKSPYLQETDGYYGAGSPIGQGMLLDLSDLNENTISQTSSLSTFSLSGNGDYEEWDILLMLKPWWDVNEWWRLTGTIGIGVTRSEFDGVVSGYLSETGPYSTHRSYRDWDCYGIAGLGTAFRVWRFDLSFDVLVHFLQDDMSIKSEVFSGSISKPKVIFCAAIGFEF